MIEKETYSVKWYNAKKDKPPFKEQVPHPDTGEMMDPPYSISVLLTNGKEISTGYLAYEQDEEEYFDYEEEEWVECGNLLSYTSEYGSPLVTHWAFLPQLPKVTNEE